jgi:hypothetical protein
VFPVPIVLWKAYLSQASLSVCCFCVLRQRISFRRKKTSPGSTLLLAERINGELYIREGEQQSKWIEFTSSGLFWRVFLVNGARFSCIWRGNDCIGSLFELLFAGKWKQGEVIFLASHPFRSFCYVGCQLGNKFSPLSDSSVIYINKL